MSDLLITSDGKLLISICASYHSIKLIDIQSKTEIHNIEEKDIIVSANISQNNKYLLINTSYKNPVIRI